MLTRAWQRAAAGLPEAPLFGHDPLTVRAAALADFCARRGLPRTVALIGPGFHPDEQRELRAHGFAADLLSCAGPRDGPGRQSYALGLLGGAHPAGGGATGLPRTHRAGLLLPQPSSGLLADKRALALVSEGLPWMTRGERRLVERRLPWTRITLAGRTTPGTAPSGICRAWCSPSPNGSCSSGRSREPGRSWPVTRRSRRSGRRRCGAPSASATAWCRSTCDRRPTRWS